MNGLVDKALAIGFTHAAWIDGLTVECEPGLRAYCNPEGCPNHGENWVCPPGCGSLEECSEKVKGFSKGLLVQSVSEIDPAANNIDRYKSLNRIHNLNLRKFLEGYCLPGADVLAFTSGGCVFCEVCAYPVPCVNPGMRMNSLSAYGMDVGKLCEKAHLEYSFRPDKVYFVALILYRGMFVE